MSLINSEIYEIYLDYSLLRFHLPGESRYIAFTWHTSKAKGAIRYSLKCLPNSHAGSVTVQFGTLFECGS